MGLQRFYDDHFCFACGQENPHGLQLRPEVADGTCHIIWTPAKRHQGYEGILHGGIVSLLLDEAMAYAARSVAGNCATAEMSTRFLKPVVTGAPLEVRGRVVENRRRRLTTEAELVQNGQLLARASARFLPVSASLQVGGLRPTEDDQA